VMSCAQAQRFAVHHIAIPSRLEEKRRRSVEIE
jgi:hypothetical protein